MRNFARIVLALAALCWFMPAFANSQVFINEIHYDNSGADTGEGIEVAGPAGTSLTGWQLVLYNGNGGGTYATYNLSGTLANQCSGYGVTSVSTPGLQNGSPDGIALIDASGIVRQFISYEGNFTATSGPASGVTSTDIGVSESGSTPVGQSLQLAGSGTYASDFTWLAPDTASFGQCNPGQSFTTSGGGSGGGSGGSGYYTGVNTSSPSALRSSLHTLIEQVTRIPYTSSSTDTWDVLEQADEDPWNSGNIIDVYKNASYAKQGGGNTYYNREHTWPKSYGFPNDVSSNYAYTDMHMLMLVNSSYNSSRSNIPYGTCNASCREYPTDNNDGVGGGSGTYPGNSNWSNGTVWEVWMGKRGDVARALLYMDVRFEGGTNPYTGYAEPDLVLTDDMSKIMVSNGNTTGTAYMGKLSVLLQWAQQDPVSDFERLRNETVESYQGNRNPFVDHPEWIACVFQNQCQ